MRTVVGMLILVIFVAAHGARAQPILSASSVAFEQCREGCGVIGRSDGGAEDEHSAVAIAAGEIPASEIAGPGYECALCGIEGLREQVCLGGIALRHEPTVGVLLFDPTGWHAP